MVVVVTAVFKKINIYYINATQSFNPKSQLSRSEMLAVAPGIWKKVLKCVCACVYIAEMQERNWK